jgi:hypothetical protein
MAKKWQIKQRKRANVCDVDSCRIREGLQQVQHSTCGVVKICAKHYQQWTDQGEPAAPAPATRKRASGDSDAIETTGESVTETPVTTEEAMRGATVLARKDTYLTALEPIRREAEENIEQLTGIQLTSQTALDAAGALLQDVKGKMKALEEQRTSATKPLLTAKTQIDGWFKPAKEALSKLETLLKRAIADYTAAQQRARLEAMAAGDHDTALAVPEPELPSGISVRSIWRWRVLNEAAIPREYMTVDVDKINKMVQAWKGQTNIAGIEVFEDSTVASRSTQ